MGFETSVFLSQPVDDNLCCSLCLEVFDRPTSACPNGHTFCEACLSNSREQQEGAGTDGTTSAATCPECRAALVDTSLLNRPLQNIIFGLRMKCDRRTQCAQGQGQGCGGCDWEGTVEEYVVHKASCDHRLVKCPLCASKVPNCSVGRHKETDECKETHARIVAASDSMAEVVNSFDTAEERTEVIFEAMIDPQMWSLTLGLGEEFGVSYISPQEYALFAATAEGEGIRDLFDGAAEINEEQARKLFVRRVFTKMHPNESGGDETEGEGGNAVPAEASGRPSQDAAAN